MVWLFAGMLYAALNMIMEAVRGAGEGVQEICLQDWSTTSGPAWPHQVRTLRETCAMQQCWRCAAAPLHIPHTLLVPTMCAASHTPLTSGTLST
jgi:hypothetical protein